MRHNIVDYGADPADPATHNAAFLVAIEACGYEGIVYAPAGDWYIDNIALQFAPPNHYIDLQGDGFTQTRLHMEGYYARIRFGGTNLTGEAGYGAMGGTTGGFSLIADDSLPPRCMLETGASSDRRFQDIWIHGGDIGLAVNTTQNAIFDHIRVDNSANGIILDHGAGGNTFIHPVLESCNTNLVFRESSGRGPKLAPSDNRFYSGLIEAQFGGTAYQVDHRAGANNYFHGTQFGGHHDDTAIRFTHNLAPAGAEPPTSPRYASHHLHLTDVYFVGGKLAVEHTATTATIHVANTHFQTIPAAFALGRFASVRMDRWNLVDCPTAGALAAGGTRTLKVGAYTEQPDVWTSILTANP